MEIQKLNEADFQTLELAEQLAYIWTHGKLVKTIIKKDGQVEIYLINDFFAAFKVNITQPFIRQVVTRKFDLITDQASIYCSVYQDKTFSEN